LISWESEKGVLERFSKGLKNVRTRGKVGQRGLEGEGRKYHIPNIKSGTTIDFSERRASDEQRVEKNLRSKEKKGEQKKHGSQ